MKSIATFTLLIIFSHFSFGQENKGSALFENSIVQIESGAVRSLFGETVYFGPQAEWIIEGTLEVWCQQLWIAPEAKIRGNGRLIIYNPSESPFYTDNKNKPTVVDGNNADFIKLLVEHHNAAGILLNNIDDPGYGTVSPSGSDAAALNFGGELLLAKDGADIRLNGYNVSFDKDAFINQFSNRRKLIMGNYGHVAKVMPQGSQFLFPVASESKHYAPATISAIDKDAIVKVRVDDFISSMMRHKDPNSGIDVNWQIFSAQPTHATLTLQHPIAANKEKYMDQKAGIYQYVGMEEINRLPSKQITEGVHQATTVTLATQDSDYLSWYTKSITLSKEFFIPNVFSPNGDGINDRFELWGIEAFDSVIVTIYNRWGDSVYQNTRYDNSWNAAGINAGTYYYVIDTFEKNQHSSFKGWVLVVK